MRGRDEETNEYRGPSRSQQRREALAVFDLAEVLVGLSDGQLAPIPMPEELREMVRDSRRITAPIARKRQLQYLAKHMRREDDEVLDAIRRALEHDRDEARRDTAALHRVEAWRDRLIEEGDAALAELLQEHPHSDRQHLRQLTRNAREERLKNKPLHAYRELFRELRTMLEGDAVDVAGNEDAPDDDIADDDDLDAYDDEAAETHASDDWDDDEEDDRTRDERSARRPGR